MTKRTLLSLVPIEFKTDPYDEISLGFHVHQLSEQMMADGIMPYSALDVFRIAQGGAGRTQQRKGYLILGEVVSETQYVKFKEAILYLKPYIWLRLLIDNVKHQDQIDARSDRHTGLLHDIFRDITYWKLCNSGRPSVCTYRPELRRAARGASL